MAITQSSRPTNTHSMKASTKSPTAFTNGMKLLSTINPPTTKAYWPTVQLSTTPPLKWLNELLRHSGPLTAIHNPTPTAVKLKPLALQPLKNSSKYYALKKTD